MFQDDLPKSVDCVVIGGGIVGVMAAWELIAQGQSVALLEKGRIAGEQSSRNWGWVRVQGRDPAEIPIMLEAREIWSDINAQLGTDIGLRTTGVTYLAKTEKELADFEAWLIHAKSWGLDTRLQSKKEVANTFGGVGSPWCGALVTPSDMRAEPWLAVPTIAKKLHENGCHIVESCAVRTLETSGGKVSSVVAELGEIKTDRVILAGGAWSSLFLRRHGVSIPQLSVKASVAATDQIASFHDGAAADDNLAFRRRLDGRYSIAPAEFHELHIGPDAFRYLKAFFPQLAKDPFGTNFHLSSPKGFPDAWGTKRRWQADHETPFERMRVLDPTPNIRRLGRLKNDLRTTLPEFKDMTIDYAWAGMIDTMPDVVPVVDKCSDIPGLTIATGMSGHGFGIGPAFGKVAAHLSLGLETKHDLSRFRLSRFHDGSKIDLGPSL